MYKVVGLLISTVFVAGTTAIAELPAWAQANQSTTDSYTIYNRNGVSVQAPGPSGSGTSNRPAQSASYNNGFSINYSQSVSTATDGQQNYSRSSSSSSWRQGSDGKNHVSVPEPSTLLGLAGVSVLSILKRRFIQKA